MSNTITKNTTHLLGLFLVLWIIISVIFHYLCVFTGSKEGFMEDSHILTLTASLANALNGTAWNSPAKSVFDSKHLVTSCHDLYTNETTTKHLRGCFTRSLFSFDPLSTAVNHFSYNKITLSGLHPYDMKYDLAGRRSNFNSALVFYLFAVALTTLALLNYIIAMPSPLITIAISIINPLLVYAALIASLVASFIMTTSTARATEMANEYDQRTGSSNIAASLGRKFLGLIWASLAVLFLAPVFMVMDAALLKSGAEERRSGVWARLLQAVLVGKEDCLHEIGGIQCWVEKYRNAKNVLVQL